MSVAETKTGGVGSVDTRCMFGKKRTTIDSWQAAEIAAAAHMRKVLKFRDAKVTTAGSDGGVDIASSKAIAQVKLHAAKTGAPDVQRLAGVASRRKTKRVFYSYAGYTPKAVDAANASRVALFIYDLTGIYRPCNRHAARLISPFAIGSPAKSQPSFREIWAGMKSETEQLGEAGRASFREQWRAMSDGKEQRSAHRQRAGVSRLGVEPWGYPKYQAEFLQPDD